MRRLTITLAAALMLAAMAPASALARHHHGRHHSRVRHARVERFGSDATSTSSGSSAADTAGTVQSFTGGVLTILLNDGSTVSGMVNNDTELECTAPETAETMHEDGDTGSGDQSGSGEDQAESSEQETETSDAGESESESRCSTANLTPGTAVREAELRISSGGSVWKKVELES